MRPMPVVIDALAVAGLLLAAASPAVSQQLGFDTQILPIFRQSCAQCHGASEPQAHLRLDSLEGVIKGGISGPAIIPGNSRAQACCIRESRRRTPTYECRLRAQPFPRNRWR